MDEVTMEGRIELVAEMTERGIILPDGKTVVTVDQLEKLLEAFIRPKLGALELTVTDHVNAALARHDQLNYDLKQFHREMEIHRKTFEIFSTRLAAVEKQLGIDPFKIDPEYPGTGHWKLTAKVNAAERRHEPVPRIAGPNAAWKKEAAQEAEKLKAELPPLSGIPDLRRRWGVSYTFIVGLIGRARITVVRQDTRILVPKEPLIEYVKQHGIPRPRVRSYGASGIKQLES